MHASEAQKSSDRISVPKPVSVHVRGGPIIAWPSGVVFSERSQALTEYLVAVTAFFLLAFAVVRLWTGKTLTEELNDAVRNRTVTTYKALSSAGP